MYAVVGMPPIETAKNQNTLSKQSCPDIRQNLIPTACNTL
jgi:hypothetical protein